MKVRRGIRSIAMPSASRTGGTGRKEGEKKGEVCEKKKKAGPLGFAWGALMTGGVGKKA